MKCLPINQEESMHLAFHSIRCNGLQMSIKRAKFKTWMSKNAMKLIKKSPFTQLNIRHIIEILITYENEMYLHRK